MWSYIRYSTATADFSRSSRHIVGFEIGKRQSSSKAANAAFCVVLQLQREPELGQILETTYKEMLDDQLLLTIQNTKI